MEQSQITALLEAIQAQGTLSKACATLGLDRRAVSRARQDDATLNARVLAAVATARHDYRERHGGADDPEDSDGEGQDTAAAIVPPKVDHALPTHSLINVPGQREPLPGHERAESPPGGVPLHGEEPKPVVPPPYHARDAQRVGLPPGAPPISGEEPKVHPDEGAVHPVTGLPHGFYDQYGAAADESPRREASPPAPLAAPTGHSEHPSYTPPATGYIGHPPLGTVLPELPADMYPPVPMPRVFPSKLSEALWRVIDEVRANPTYARNLQVRLATFQGGDSGPLTGLIDAMMEA